ncbi:hypothetical protein C7451_102241 [Blastomonas natatoria]|uniref:Twin-arginine translocation pathway signal protein n=1 Tax=Blastomonas natatoria TaxID=34015 RepID=A0A2V3VPU4_9SPHN|nr:twin-arginine translocation pathway signal protein [Blastomonas natatoria]PXW78569.1 hypothetical protein C7451_102241 [Blastomonas natatoria]
MTLLRIFAALPLAFAAPALAQDGSGYAATQRAEAASFVPAEFKVPTLVEGPGFKLVPLGPDLVRVDFEAYMSSIEHLQKTFTRSTAWPHPNISDADAMKDMQTEQGRFQRRESFAYAVLTPDGKRERGCVYVYPSPVPGYDAMVTLWVTKAEHDAGFDAKLYAWVQQWIAKDWPLRSVAYPGRAIDWGTWDALEAASKAKTPG